MSKNEAQKVATEAKKSVFYLPELGTSVVATSIDEAIKIAKSQKKGENDGN